jgi:hypothetical protein
VVVNLESSGVGRNSFPTDLGWAIASQDGGLEFTSWLIKPPARWTSKPDAWSAASERLTGITKEMLDAVGISPAQAMSRFLADVGHRVYSSDPDFDCHWLTMLATAASVDIGHLQIGDARKLIEAARGIAGPKEGPRHRAGADAMRLALLYSLAIQR